MTIKPEQRAYQPINSTIDEKVILKTFELYADFLRLPFEQRKLVHHVDASRPRIGTSGYTFKGEDSPEGSARQDKKHTFHMSSGLIKSIDLPTLPREASLFCMNAMSLHVSLNRAAKKLYEQLESEVPNLVDIHFPQHFDWAHHTRIIGYTANSGSQLAAPHYDKSTSTIAFASEEGLRVGGGPDDLEPVDQSPLTPIHFFGYGWHQLTNMLDAETEHQPGWHDVVDVPTPYQSNQNTVYDRIRQIGSSIGITRFAVAHFINPAHVYLDSTTDQTHTPLG